MSLGWAYSKKRVPIGTGRAARAGRPWSSYRPGTTCATSSCRRSNQPAGPRRGSHDPGREGRVPPGLARGCFTPPHGTLADSPIPRHLPSGSASVSPPSSPSSPGSSAPSTGPRWLPASASPPPRTPAPTPEQAETLLAWGRVRAVDGRDPAGLRHLRGALARPRVRSRRGGGARPRVHRWTRRWCSRADGHTSRGGRAPTVTGCAGNRWARSSSRSTRPRTSSCPPCPARAAADLGR